MATFKITNDNSVAVSGFVEFAFAEDTPQADTLIVDPDAFLISQGGLGIGAFLASTLGWKVTVNGSVVSFDFAGIYLNASNAAASTITIGADGTVGGRFGLYLGSAATVKNSGLIVGSEIGIRIVDPGARTITNSGTISGGLNGIAILDESGSSTDKVTNTGELIGRVELAGGNDSLTNSGRISNSVHLGAGNNTFVNSGDVGGPIRFGDDADTFRNSGNVDLFIEMGGGTNFFENTGFIIGLNGGVDGGSGNDTFVNKGIIESSIELFDGANVFTNSGTVDGTVTGGSNNDVVNNTGTLGDVFLGNGTNTLTNSGTINAIVGGSDNDTVTNKGTIRIIQLNAGNDTFNGGNQAESVRDWDGSDTYKLGSGNDVYNAANNGSGDGNDLVDGGAGIDRYSASDAQGLLVINIDTVAHADPFNASIMHAANTGTGAEIAGAGRDTILGFEHVTGGTGSGGDIIYGSAVANEISGLDGHDHLYGFAGNDRLTGGSGDDRLHGGAGKDVLRGDTGLDWFVFAATSESAPGTRDTIADFTDGQDLIVLSAIDANTKVAGDDAFNFIGINAKFGGVAGELRAYFSGDGLMVEGDINGDKKADLSIFLQDPTHALNAGTFTAADFLL